MLQLEWDRVAVHVRLLPRFSPTRMALVLRSTSVTKLPAAENVARPMIT